MDEYDKYLGENSTDSNDAETVAYDSAPSEFEAAPAKPTLLMKIIALPKGKAIAFWSAVFALIAGVVITSIVTQPDSAVETQATDKSAVSVITSEVSEDTTVPTTEATTNSTAPTTDPVAVPAETPADVATYLPLPTTSLDAARGTILSGMSALTKTTWQEHSGSFTPESLALFAGDPAAFVPLVGEVTIKDTVMLMANDVAVNVAVGDTVWLVSASRQDGSWLITSVDSTVVNDVGGE